MCFRHGFMNTIASPRDTVMPESVSAFLGNSHGPGTGQLVVVGSCQGSWYLARGNFRGLLFLGRLEVPPPWGGVGVCIFFLKMVGRSGLFSWQKQLDFRTKIISGILYHRPSTQNKKNVGFRFFNFSTPFDARNGHWLALWSEGGQLKGPSRRKKNPEPEPLLSHRDGRVQYWVMFIDAIYYHF